MINITSNPIGRYIDALSDIGFKTLFCNENTTFIPISFINAILPPDRQIKTIELLDREIQGITNFNKTSHLDFHCIDGEDREFIVEMQIGNYDNFYLRSLYYATRVFNSNLEISRRPNYGTLKPVYLISIIKDKPKEDELNEMKELLNWFKMYDVEHKVVAPNVINIIFVCLKNLPKN